MIAAIDLTDDSTSSALSHHPARDGMDQSLRGHDGNLYSVRLPTVLSLAQSTSRSEFTVISRNFR